VVEDVGAIAPGILQRVGEDWQRVEGAIRVNAFGERNDSGPAPRGVGGHGPEGVAEDVADQPILLAPLAGDELWVEPARRGGVGADVIRPGDPAPSTAGRTRTAGCGALSLRLDAARVEEAGAFAIPAGAWK
jgi:hypothetical protein